MRKCVNLLGASEETMFVIVRALTHMPKPAMRARASCLCTKRSTHAHSSPVLDDGMHTNKAVQYTCIGMPLKVYAFDRHAPCFRTSKTEKDCTVVPLQVCCFE